MRKEKENKKRGKDEHLNGKGKRTEKKSDAKHLERKS